MSVRDVEITFFRAGGPGGQHRNKTETGVRLLHTPTGITVQATERRSRRQNLDVAFERLKKKLEEYYRPKKKRVATKPTRASKEKRLESKHRRAATKQNRKRPPGGE